MIHIHFLNLIPHAAEQPPGPCIAHAQKHEKQAGMMTRRQPARKSQMTKNALLFLH
jgi:hypothetical protein